MVYITVAVQAAPANRQLAQPDMGNGYTISETGKPPDYVSDVASASIFWRDVAEERGRQPEAELRRSWN